MKKLAKIIGVKTLDKKAQRRIGGGARGKCCNPTNDCCVPNNGAPHPGCGQYGNPNCNWLYSANGCCF